jgi:uncharacterized protein
MARIGIDIDSTLHHYWEVFAAIVRRRTGHDLPYATQEDWHIGALDPAVLRECVAETHADEHVLAAEPYPGAVEAVRRWHEAGHFIHITSHRSTDAHAATERWLDRIGLPYDELYCSFDKVTRCVEIGIDVLVDDSPVNLVRAREEGIRGATLLHPWNREVVAEHGIVAAADWPGLEAALEPILAR